MNRLHVSMLIAGAALCAPAGWAQGSGIGGPVTGFVLDGRSHSLRPINGAPGASMLGAAVQMPFAVGLSATSSALDFALATDINGDGRPVVARGLRSGAPSVSPVGGAISASSLMLAESGAAALLYSKNAGQMQLVDGLPAAATSHDAVDVSSVDGGVVAYAFDGAGMRALLVGGNGGIYSLNLKAGEQPKWLVKVPGATSVAFVSKRNAAVVGNSTGDVLLMDDLRGRIVVRTLAGARNGITRVSAVHSLGGNEVGAIDGDSGGLAAIDLVTGDTNWVALAGAADSFEHLDGSLLLLNRVGDQTPLLLLDITRGRTAYFVPAENGSNAHVE